MMKIFFFNTSTFFLEVVEAVELVLLLLIHEIAVISISPVNNNLKITPKYSRGHKFSHRQLHRELRRQLQHAENREFP